MGVWGDRCFGGIDDLIWDFYKLKSTCLWGGLDLIGNFVVSSHLILRKCLTWLGILWFQVISSCGSTWLDWKFYDFKSSHLTEMLDLPKYASTTPRHPRTPPPLPRETPLFGRVRTASGVVLVQPNTTLKSPPLGLSYPRTAFPVQALPRRVSPVQEKPAQINTK